MNVANTITTVSQELGYPYDMYQWLMLFFFYSFLGWVYESLYVSICKRKWVNRGFMVGPMLPLYGSGAIVMLLASMPFQDNLVLVFFSGCVGATLLEYVTGGVMEKLFKVRYWDYSNKPLNFQGHIWLGATLLWGVFTVVMVKVLNPPVAEVVTDIREPLLQRVVYFISLVAIADFTYSFKAALDLRAVLVRLQEARLDAEHLRHRMDALIAFANDSKNMRLEQLQQKYREGTEKARQGKNRLENYMETRLDGMRLQLEELKSAEKRFGIPHSVEFRKYWEERDDIKVRLAVFVEKHKESQKQYSFGIRNLLQGNPDAVTKEDDSLLEELRSTLKEGKNNRVTNQREGTQAKSQLSKKGNYK